MQIRFLSRAAFLAAGLVPITFATTTIFAWQPAAASADDIEKLLVSQSLAGLDGKVASLVEISAPPGFQTPRHLHPGNMFVYVLEGEVALELDGHAPVVLRAGGAAYEVPGVPMVGRNLSATEGARLLIFNVGDADAPDTVPAD